MRYFEGVGIDNAGAEKGVCAKASATSREHGEAIKDFKALEQRHNSFEAQ